MIAGVVWVHALFAASEQAHPRRETYVVHVSEGRGQENRAHLAARSLRSAGKLPIDAAVLVRFEACDGPECPHRGPWQREPAELEQAELEQVHS